MSSSGSRSLADKYRAVFGTPEGGAVLADIMDRGLIFKPLTNGDKDIGRSDLAKEIMLLALSEKTGVDKKTGQPHRLLDGRRFKDLMKKIAGKTTDGPK